MMNRSRVRWRATALLTAALVAGAIALSACSSTTPKADATPTKDTLTMSIGRVPTGLNLPTNCTSPIFSFTYDALINVGPDGQYAPGIAKSWEYGDGNTTFTLHIRSGVKFADGTKLTATSVANTLKWLQATPGVNQGYLKAFTAIDTPDANTVKITLSKPFRGMETLLSNDRLCNDGFPVSAAGLADPSKMGTQTFGAGAYVIDPANTVAGDHYTLLPNKNYWDPSKQHWKKIIIRTITDANTAYQALQTGQTDIQLDATPTLADSAEKAKLNVVEGGNGGAALFLLDRNGVVTPALKDLRVRQAIAYALDRDSLVKVMGPGWKPLVQFGVPGSTGYDKSLESTFSYNPAKAKKLLAEAGYANGFDLPILDQQGVNAAPDSTQAIIQELAAVGIRGVATTAKDVPTLAAAATSKKYTGFNFRTIGDINWDTARILIPPFNGVLDPFGSSNPAVTQAYNTSVTSSDKTVEANSKALNKTITDLAWVVSYAYAPQVVFSSSAVKISSKTSALGQLDVFSFVPAK